MNIKEIANKMTREEFLNKLNFETDGYAVNGGKILNTFINCPCDINLEDDDCGTGRYCIDCWRQAIKDIKFKGEDKVKELTFKEVIANIKEGEKWICTDKSLAIQSISMKNNGAISIEHDRQYRITINRARFIKEQQPVTFEEVLNSNKKCMVEHELIDKDDEWYKIFQNLDDLLYEISANYDLKDLKNIIKNGKWYLED